MSVRRAQDERIEGNPDGLNAITEIPDVPDAPTIGTASDSGDGTTASVTFTAPATGGTATTYRVLSTPDSVVGTGGSSPVSVTGLSTGTAYTFQVRGENSTANGPYSSASGSLTLAPPPSFYSIATTTVGSGGSSGITFDLTGVSGYKHLQIRGIARTARATFANDGIKFQFNSDTGANYSRHSIAASETSYDLSGGSSQTYFFSQIAGNGAMANMFGSFVCDILDYTNTNKYKTVRILSGENNNSAADQQGGFIGLFSGNWMNTNAITSITIFGFSGNLLQYSSFALYGIK